MYTVVALLPSSLRLTGVIRGRITIIMLDATHQRRSAVLSAAHLAGHAWAQGFRPGDQPYPDFRELRHALSVSALRHPRLERAAWNAWLEGASEVRPVAGVWP